MSTNLNLPQVTPSQLNKTVTQNDANGGIDAALTERLVLSVTSSNAITLTDVQFRETNFFVFDDGGATSNVTITVSSIKRGFFLVANNTGFDLQVKIAAQTVEDTQGSETVMWYCDGINCFIPRAQALLSGTSAVAPSPAATTVPGFRGVCCTLVSDYLNAPGTTIPWTQESYDTDVFHDNAINNQRITIPVSSGITRVKLGANVQWLNAGTSSGFTFARIQMNAIVPIETSSSNFRAANADPRNVLLTAAIDVVEGDYFEVFVNQSNAGADINNEQSNFWLEVLEADGDGGNLGHPPFDGARVYKGSDQALTDNTFTALTWDQEEFDTDTYHDNSTNNERFTIPTGVTKVRLHCALQFEAWTGGGGSAGDIGLQFAKNGSANFRGNAEVHHDGPQTGSSQANLMASTSVVDVVATDYFEVRGYHNFGVTKNIVADSGFKTWFEIEVIERTTTPHYDLETYHSGTPGSSQLIRRWVMPRLIILPADMDSSAAYANMAPSSQTDFDVQRNGVSIGTIRFAGSSQTATFINTGDDTFNAGDRMEIVAPGTLNGISDISFAIAFRRAF